MLERKGVILKWVGVTNIEEGEQAGDGISYRVGTTGGTLYLRFKFLRLIAMAATYDRVRRRLVEFGLYQRTWDYLNLMDRHPRKGLGWTTIFQMEFRRHRK